MQYRPLINTDLSLSAVGFGCCSYWGMQRFSETSAHRLLGLAIELGINYFDNIAAVERTLRDAILAQIANAEPISAASKRRS